MSNYLLYCFDGHRLIRCDHFLATDDESAIDHAFEHHGGMAAELWTGN